jgi:cardiolipin synthase
MKNAGAEVAFYHNIKWPNVITARTVNNRTHRKLLVIDGRIGFTGGAGIADEWDGHADGPEEWRDNHYRVEGPVVAQFQAAFLDTWMEATGEVLHGPGYFPALDDAGPLKAQMFMSSYRGGSESMHLMYLLSFTAARSSIRLATAYFVPDALTSQALIEARKRGVNVQIILPGPHADPRITREASRARWGDLLRAGIEIYEYQPSMYHCKLMVVDDLWTSIGSSNLDNRSFSLNDEANLNILDENFARQQARIFDTDLVNCRRITLEEWQRRSLAERITEGLASLFGSQM